MQSADWEVLTTARNWLLEGRRIWLVTVSQTFGASPRPPGSMMAMRDDGIVIGSVSGGCIEDDLVARRNEFAGVQPQWQSYGVSAEEARRFGLPCGGQLEVLIEPQVVIDALERVIDKIHRGEVFARDVDCRTGAWQLRAATPNDAVVREADRFVCIHGPRWRLLVIGASEIARYLAEIAGSLDFQVHICDPREEYRRAWRIEGCQWAEGMPDDAVVAFRPDAHTVIVTVSHDPKLDDMALMEALKSDAYYVGAVGSERTNVERRKRLMEFDLSAAQVARLHGPVGLALGSRTPPEIAIAILAELVAVRNGVMLARSQRHAHAAN